jgi:hypothetical protein
MGPLIDAELELVDRRHAQLTRISTELVDALNLYHQLMHEGQAMQHPGYGMGMPNQYQLPTANHAPLYMPHMPGVIASSPQHQQQVYQQNINQPPMPSLQGVAQPVSSYQLPTGTATAYQNSFNSPNQQPSAGNPVQSHMNGQPTEQQQQTMRMGSAPLNPHDQAQQGAPSVVMQHQSYYPTTGNAPPPGTGQINSQAPTSTTASQNQQMTQRVPPQQQIDPQFTSVTVAQQLNQPQHMVIPNGTNMQVSSNPSGSVHPIQVHGMTSPQELPPFNWVQQI